MKSKTKGWKRQKYEFELIDEQRKVYKLYKNYINKQKIQNSTVFENFPFFTGKLTFIKFLSLYEIYKKIKNLHGHIGEIGVYNGTTSIFFGKLLEIFEPHSLTLVHGFDWFKGNRPTRHDSDKQIKNGSKGNYKYLIDNIKMQKLDKRIKIHKIDLKKINEFFKKNENRAIYFKLVYFDCGIYDVVKPAIRNIWKRVVPGGIIILDQLYHSLAPGETKAKNELLSEYKSYKLDFSWMPTAYIVKEKK